MVDIMGKRSYTVGYIIIVENFCLSETCRPTPNCMLFDRFDWNLSNYYKAYREKSV